MRSELAEQSCQDAAAIEGLLLSSFLQASHGLLSLSLLVETA